MKFVTYLFLFLLIIGVFQTHFQVRRSQSDKERDFMVRVSIFAWMLGLLFLAALLFLPTQQKVLAFLPGAVFALGLGRVWRAAKARIRREESARINFEKMKRAN
ncbi:MAG: hypothetical protein M3463_09810 [Verrucomicrobiota bacterium]|nr:hypothetical protein [Verrucomicrobiota bacterium]